MSQHKLNDRILLHVNNLIRQRSSIEKKERKRKYESDRVDSDVMRGWSECVCVDVKPLFVFVNFAGGLRTYAAPSNEAHHMILGYHQGRLVTYLLHFLNS